MAFARNTALHLLSRRDYTTAELRKKLNDREFPEDEIATALASLAADRLLDDRRVAAAHIRTASRIKHRGRLRIQRELEARGIDRAVIRELILELPAAEESDSIEHFLRRRGVTSRQTAPERRRLFQQLMRRGFGADVIAKALRGRGDDE
jgi:regulatory protein